MSSDLEPTKIDYIIRSISKQVYNVFPFVSIKCEPGWDKSIYGLYARWHYKGSSHVFMYEITDDLLNYIADDLDYIVYSLVHRICDEIMKSCNEDKETEDN